MGSIVGGIIGGKKQAKAANKQGALVRENMNASVNDLRAARDYTVDAFAPYATVGANALTGYVADLESGAYDPRNFDFQADPGYQFRLGEGQRALEGSAAARGGLLSGAQLKAGTRYGQDFASNEYNRAYGRNANALAFIAGLNRDMVGVGMQGSGAQSNAYGNYANSAANVRMQGAQGMGNALMNAANAKANMWSGIGGGLDNAIGMGLGAFGGFGTGASGGGAAYPTSFPNPYGNLTY